MEYLILGFAGGDAKIIESVSDGLDINISHAFIYDRGLVWEATGIKEDHDLYSGFWPHDIKKYVGNPAVRYVLVPLPDITAARTEILRLVGTPYGGGDCFRAGVYALSGIQIPDNKAFVDCSESDVRAIRAGGMVILPDLEAGCIAPASLYKALIAAGCQDVTHEINTQLAVMTA